MAMGLLLFFNFFLIFIAFWVHGCAGFSINSLKSAVSLLRFEHGLGRHNLRQFDTAMAPSLSNFRHPWKKHVHDYSSSISPSGSVHKKHHKRNLAPQPSYLLPQSHGYSPSLSPYRSPAPAPSSSRIKIPMAAPTMSPLRSLDKKKKTTATTTLPSSPFMLLPPPPPNEDCTSLICSAPLTNTPSGSPCGCVWPIEVRLRLNIELYTFFPLVSELAKEIALGFSLNESQVRIMGANAATQQLDRTVVLINLVPLQGNFNSKMTYFVYEKFWKKQLPIRGSLFGAYDVVDVRYPGLPPSPPLVPTAMDGQPFPNHGNDGMAIKPIGVDISRREEKSHIQGSIVTVIVLSSATAFMVFLGLAWLLIWKFNCRISHTDRPPESLPSSHQKTTPGNTNNVTTITGMSSASMSFDSNLLAYTGTAKIFSLNEIEKATDNFEDLRILGEGGFGLVYRGVLDDGRRVAVKVLKRDDKQGSREFLAEVEMLSRLHHRNLVKLIGICSEEHRRCLIYELVPNGSVESHLHGIDKETAPLDWSARMKIALGAARGLAYLHEDSSPRVIHRDFKSSNILLEHDFTPKVSDFGLARAAIDEGNKHISTHVMGTFGYLAPEYAMTGHLLVKSDVYSYGVVLLELLTGRKPVDLSQPPGQENLVAWARPLLGSKEGLEMIVDPALKSNIPFDSAAKVAAIASMCVQPEVSHRPFMGEVVQALKLVCDEFDETKELISRSCSLEEEISAGFEGREFDSIFETRIPLSDLKEVSTSLGGDQEFESFRRESNSAPLKMERRRGLWQRLRGLSRGSMSEHGFSSKL